MNPTHPIVKLRAAFGITQKDLAKKTGLSRSSIARYELDDLPVTDASVAKFADAFGVTPEVMRDYLNSGGDVSSVFSWSREASGESGSSVSFLVPRALAELEVLVGDEFVARRPPLAQLDVVRGWIEDCAGQLAKLDGVTEADLRRLVKALFDTAAQVGEAPVLRAVLATLVSSLAREAP